MTLHYPEPFVDQSYSQLAMPAVSQSAELSVAWALVCILHILASDSLQSREDQHDSVLVAPASGVGPAKSFSCDWKGTTESLDPEMQVSFL